MDAATLSILIAGILSIIAAIVAGTVSIISAARKGQTENGEKLDNITILVDGRYGAVLRRVAEVLTALAKVTKDPIDIENARKAMLEADDQEERVRQAAASRKGVA